MSKRKEKTPAVQLIVQSGLVPKNVLHQMKAWKLIPENLEEEAGSHPVSLESGWTTAEAFVKELDRVISEEAATIRETEFLASNELEVVWLTARGHDPRVAVPAVVDGNLNRVVLAKPWSRLNVKSISRDGGKTFHAVIATEERYSGDEPFALVCYVENV